MVAFMVYDSDEVIIVMKLITCWQLMKTLLPDSYKSAAADLTQ